MTLSRAFGDKRGYRVLIRSSDAPLFPATTRQRNVSRFENRVANLRADRWLELLVLRGSGCLDFRSLRSTLTRNPSHPVEQVSWNEIQPFLAKLNESGSADKMTFALPTEAQWEYACRAGTTTPYYGGESENEIRGYGWFNAN